MDTTAFALFGPYVPEREHFLSMPVGPRTIAFLLFIGSRKLGIMCAFLQSPGLIAMHCAHTTTLFPVPISLLRRSVRTRVRICPSPDHRTK